MKKIFIGLEEIAGYNSRLKLGFDQLGVQSTFVSLKSHKFKYEACDNRDKLISVLRLINDKRSIGFVVFRIWNHILYYLLLPLLFLRAMFEYDVFILGFMNTFFRYYELPILKIFGKKIIYVFFGSDSRPPYINKRNLESFPIKNIRMVCKQKAAIRKIERYADIIINHPPSSHLHERKFIPFMRIGFPSYCDVAGCNSDQLHNSTMRILHAPSHMEGKGTAKIRTAMASLKGKGYIFEYVEIIDKPNALVIDELMRCDFVVDELYSDAVMAGFATEAAFFGKPAVVGGYATLADFGILPEESMPPVHHCHPDDIEAAIEKLIVDESYRKDLGLRAKQFVNQNWSARSVAERYMRIIDGEIPEDWFHDPRDIRYLHGWGLQENQARKLVRSVIEYGGIDALQLADKPDLAQRFYRFAFRVDS
jgi:glycosyltransferase involved in cell wall biosynthesis